MATETQPLQRDLEQLSHDHRLGVWRYLRFLGCSPELADDLSQETFVAAMQGPFEDRSRAETSAWLRTTARNLYLGMLRSQDQNVVLDNPEVADSVWERFERDDGGEHSLLALRDCLDTLEGRGKEAVQLQYKERKSRLDIAAILDMKPDGVKTLLRRTRALLKNCIQRKLES